MYRFLFRGMIRYDITDGIHTGDLTNCDITDISLVRCTLRDDAVWSDGTRIKLDDIIASIDTYKKSSPKSGMRVFLEQVTLNKNGETLEIRSKIKDENMIEMLTYPIVRSDTITRIRDNTITPQNYVTSGPYTFGESITDTQYGFDRVTLIRNEKWARTTWLDKINFKFFRDLSSMERSAETLTIIIPPAKNEKLEVGPRFREYLYTNYEYFGVFFNTRTLNRSLRNILHWQIGSSFDDDMVADHTRRDTIFLSGWALLPSDTLRGFADVLREMWYTKKSEILSKIESVSTTLSGEPVFEKTKYWNTSVWFNTLYVSEKTSEIILTGTVPTDTVSIEINGYALKEFVPGNTNFVYKVTTASGTLIEGKNIYTLNLNPLSGRSSSEILTIYNSTDVEKMTWYKKSEQDKYNALQNTPALIADRERKKSESLKEAQTLKDEYYYKWNDIFVIRIGYITGPQSTQSYATSISDALRLLGVKTELIAYGPKELQNMISSSKRDYDLLAIGISVEWSLSRIWQVFAVSEIGSGGINFAGIANKSLDALFVELEWTTDRVNVDKIQKNISKIMNTESFFVPISSPYHRIWVDRNIKWMPQVDTIPDIASLSEILVDTSIKENYIKNLANKSVSGFGSWIFSKLYNPSWKKI